MTPTMETMFQGAIVFVSCLTQSINLRPILTLYPSFPSGVPYLNRFGSLSHAAGKSQKHWNFVDRMEWAFRRHSLKVIRAYSLTYVSSILNTGLYFEKTTDLPINLRPILIPYPSSTSDP